MKTPDKSYTALKVNEGISPPPSINSKAASQYKIHFKKKTISIDDYFKEIIKGNRSTLSKAITLIESSLKEHEFPAQDLIRLCVPFSGNSIRIGITGIPGVGKSTFIEALGKFLINNGRKVAVLAIDPSSTKSRGSILGDKTRMEELAKENNAFIRPSPSSGTLGGVARKTRESIILCEAAGFDTIIIETVGVGQSETEVHSMVDFFLLLMIAGAGDELQGIKKGIMEMADAIILNKADGDNINKVNESLSEIKSALHLYYPAESGWTTKTGSCSAINRSGITEVWNMIIEYQQLTQSNKYFYQNRQAQALHVFHQSIKEKLVAQFYNYPKIKKLLQKAEEDVVAGKLSAYNAADLLFNHFLDKK
jgi:LAO/AO transport system kinase